MKNNRSIILAIVLFSMKNIIFSYDSIENMSKYFSSIKDRIDACAKFKNERIKENCLSLIAAELPQSRCTRDPKTGNIYEINIFSTKGTNERERIVQELKYQRFCPKSKTLFIFWMENYSRRPDDPTHLFSMMFTSFDIRSLRNENGEESFNCEEILMSNNLDEPHRPICQSFYDYYNLTYPQKSVLNIPKEK
jgi:hypothetical protein